METTGRLTRCLLVSSTRRLPFQVECLLFGTFPSLHSSSLRGRRSGFVPGLSAGSSALETAGPYLVCRLLLEKKNHVRSRTSFRARVSRQRPAAGTTRAERTPCARPPARHRPCRQL